MKNQHSPDTQRIANPQRQPKEPLRKRLLTVKEASIYLGRSIPAIRELIWAGKLPIVKSDRRIFFDINDIDKWIEQHKTRYTY